jgi:hypothetical protein
MPVNVTQIHHSQGIASGNQVNSNLGGSFVGGGALG